MVDFDGRLTANGEPLPDAWIGGLSRSYSVVSVGRRYASLDIELTPLGAYTVLGRPMAELTGRCAPLADIFGPELAERLREARSWDERFDVLERFLLARAAVGPRPTPAVESALARLRGSGGNVRIDALAAEIGCSRRYLQRRFTAEVGLGPKTLARQIRFARVCARVREEPAAWSRVAARRATTTRHICTGTSASWLVRHRRTSLPVCCRPEELVGDGVPFIQDPARVPA